MNQDSPAQADICEDDHVTHQHQETNRDSQTQADICESNHVAHQQ